MFESVCVHCVHKKKHQIDNKLFVYCLRFLQIIQFLRRSLILHFYFLEYNSILFFVLFMCA